MRSILPLDDDMKAFCKEFQEFVDTELVPNYPQWTEDRECSREVYKKMAEHGWLCSWADPKYGGAGKPFIYDVLATQIVARAGLSGLATWLHADVVSPYVDTFGSEELKAEIMPQLVSGEKLICVAMTEPEHGSALAEIETTAVEDGDDFVINGHKVFTTNGYISDYVVVAAKTDPELGSKGISLFLVDKTQEGVQCEKMKKIAFHAQDTSEFHFNDVRVPKSRMLGERGKGYGYLMSKLQTERLIAATLAQGLGEYVLDVAAKYAKDRDMYGTKLFKLQDCKFKFADMYMKTAAAKALLEATTIAYLNGEDITVDVSAAKALTTETAYWVADQATQIVGGKAICYTDERGEVGRIWSDLRFMRMSAGTTEIMKVLVARGV